MIKIIILIALLVCLYLFLAYIRSAKKNEPHERAPENPDAMSGGG